MHALSSVYLRRLHAVCSQESAEITIRSMYRQREVQETYLVLWQPRVQQQKNNVKALPTVW